MTGDPVVWVNGSFTGRIDPLDRGLTLGDGVFDTSVAFNRIAFAGALHLQRLVAQAATIGIEVDRDTVRAGWRAVLGNSPTPAILRTTVTRGRAERGLWPATATGPTIVVSATAWSRSLYGREVRLVTGIVRRNADAPSSRLKSLGYLDNILAARTATVAGADDALLLNTSGRAACTTIANLFAVIGDEVVTPPEGEGIMAGIMRGLVLAAVPRAGLRASKRPLDPAELSSADAVFTTNSVRFLSQVVSLDGNPLGARGGDAIAALRGEIERQVLAECGVDPGAETQVADAAGTIREAPAPSEWHGTYRIFVRDLVLPVRIGIYEHERHAPQNVRFDVSVEVRRGRGEPRGIGDIFSYDLVAERIAAIVAEGHIDFVETLAERIGTEILRDPRAVRVSVRIAKLEIGPGSVGVEIDFERPAAEMRVIAPADRSR